MNYAATIYQQDFLVWLQQQVGLLQQGRLAELDVHNLVEELESMGISQHHQLLNRLRVLLMHLLKWQFQPSHRSGSWKGTIVEQRERLWQLLKTSPSLKAKMADKVTESYHGAIKRAAAETGLPDSTFPKVCPYTLEQILDEDFYPGET